MAHLVPRVVIGSVRQPEIREEPKPAINKALIISAVLVGIILVASVAFSVEYSHIVANNLCPFGVAWATAFVTTCILAVQAKSHKIPSQISEVKALSSDMPAEILIRLQSRGLLKLKGNLSYLDIRVDPNKTIRDFCIDLEPFFAIPGNENGKHPDEQWQYMPKDLRGVWPMDGRSSFVKLRLESSFGSRIREDDRLKDLSLSQLSHLYVRFHSFVYAVPIVPERPSSFFTSCHPFMNFSVQLPAWQAAFPDFSGQELELFVMAEPQLTERQLLQDLISTFNADARESAFWKLRMVVLKEPDKLIEGQSFILSESAHPLPEPFINLPLVIPSSPEDQAYGSL